MFNWFMKDIYEIRLINLRSLVERAGNRKELANRLDMQYQLLSNYIGKTPTKKVGDQTARLAEEVFNLEYGWMDNLHGPDQLVWPFRALRHEDVAKLDSHALGQLEATVIHSAEAMGINLGNKSTKDPAAA